MIRSFQFDHVINEQVYYVNTTKGHIFFNGFGSNAYNPVGKVRGYVLGQFGCRGFTRIRLASMLSITGFQYWHIL